MHPLEQLALLGPELFNVVSGIGPQDLDKPTPCASFTVHNVLEHMVQGATVFGAGFRGEAVPLGTPEGSILERFGPALEQLVAAVAGPGNLERSLETPFGPLPAQTFARYVVLDGLVHGWDLAAATGQTYDPPAELVATVAAFAADFLAERRGADTFDQPTVPPAGASPVEQLAAFTGRTVTPARA